jgi:LPS export ABC transporter protein LptC
MNSKALTYRLQRFPSLASRPWIKLALITVLLGGMLVSCENDIEKIKQIDNSESLPVIAAQGYEMLSFDSTVLIMKLQTPEMIIHDSEKEPYTEFPQGVALTQYDSKRNVTSYITSQYAKYFDAENRWEAKNKVVAVNQNGDTLRTEYLVWDEKKGKIYSDQFVKITRKDGQVSTGTSFEANQNFSEYVIKNLKGQMYVEVQE